MVHLLHAICAFDVAFVSCSILKRLCVLKKWRAKKLILESETEAFFPEHFAVEDFEGRAPSKQ